MTSNPQPTHYWAYQQTHVMPGDKWYIYAAVQPGRSISWGGAPLVVVTAQDAEYVRRTGKLPTGSE